MNYLILSLLLFVGTAQAEPKKFIQIEKVKSFAVGKNRYSGKFGYRLVFFEKNATYTDDILLDIDHSRTTDKFCIEMIYKVLADTQGKFNLELFVRPWFDTNDTVTLNECRLIKK